MSVFACPSGPAVVAMNVMVSPSEFGTHEGRGRAVSGSLERVLQMRAYQRKGARSWESEQ